MIFSRLALFASCSAMLVGFTAAPSFARQTPATKAPAAKTIVNKTCPITGEDIDPGTPTVTYKGHEVGFCCPGCDKKWLKQTDTEKEAFMAKWVTVAHDQPEAKVPVKTADAKAGSSKAANKVCPVSKEELEADSPTLDYNGKTVGFCCKSCMKKFSAMDNEKKAELVAFALKAAPTDKDVMAANAHQTTLTGTLVDLACYLKGEKVDDSKESVACAESCVLQKGMPAGLLVSPKDGGSQAKLYILLNSGEKSSADLYKGHFGKTASYCGQAFEKDGVSVLFVDHEPDASDNAKANGHDKH